MNSRILINLLISLVFSGETWCKFKKKNTEYTLNILDKMRILKFIHSKAHLLQSVSSIYRNRTDGKYYSEYTMTLTGYISHLMNGGVSLNNTCSSRTRSHRQKPELSDKKIVATYLATDYHWKKINKITFYLCALAGNIYQY